MGLWLRGHIAERGFDNDNDTNTVDYHPLFLMALANCKQHYGQQDAGSVFKQLEVLMGAYAAGSYGLQKFVPTPPEPKRARYGAALPYPRVTFPWP